MTRTLLIKEPPLLLYPTLAQKIGLNEAIILQQVHYWLNPKLNKNCFNDKLWVRNTYKQWQRQFPFWPCIKIRRIFTRLEEGELLISFTTNDSQRFKYYTINYEKLCNLIKIEHPRPSPSNRLDRCDQIYRTPERNDHTSAQIDHTPEQNDQLPSDHSDHICGQNDHTPLINLITPYIEAENTYTETTHLPPLTPPSKNFLQREEEEEFFKKLIEFWNDAVQTKLHPSAPEVQLTRSRRQKLRQIMSAMFNNDPEQWKVYCGKISQSRFLMGENPSGFKITLDWASNEENTLKVLEGAIYDKPQETKSKELPWSDYVDKLKHYCAENHYSDDWVEVCTILARALGQPTFESWFTRISPVDVSKTKIILSAESSFISQYIQSNFHWDLLIVLQRVYPQATSFEIQTRGKSTC